MPISLSRKSGRGGRYPAFFNMVKFSLVYLWMTIRITIKDIPDQAPDDADHPCYNKRPRQPTTCWMALSAGVKNARPANCPDV